MPPRLRLLWVCPELPRLGIAAARERFWNLLTRLAARHHVSLLASVAADEAGRTDVLPPGLADVRLVPRGSYVPDDPMALLPPAVRGGVADPVFVAAVRDALAGRRYDVVQFEYTEMGHAMPTPTIRTVLTVHQVGFAQVGPRWRAAGGGLVAGAVALFRYCRDLDFELHALARAHHVVTMSAEDAERLRRFVPDLSVSVSPMGVDCTRYRPPEPAPTPTTDLLFVGHFGHPPNVDAVELLARDVLPRLPRRPQLTIAGHAPPPEITALARPGVVEVLGSVPDVRPLLAAARIVVAPVRFGTGMRGKVLEALAMGRPVVTTTLGAEGLGATPGQHLLVADDAAGIAAAIDRLLGDEPFARQLGARARALAVSRFDWDAVADAHDAIYDRVRATRTSPPVSGDGALRIVRPIARLGRVPALAVSALVLGARALRHHRGRRAPRPLAPLSV